MQVKVKHQTRANTSPIIVIKSKVVGSILVSCVNQGNSKIKIIK